MEDPINQPLLNHKDEEADVDFNKEITEKIQSGFVVKVYGILLYQLFFCGILIVLSMAFPWYKTFIINNPSFLYVAVIPCFIIALLPCCFPKVYNIVPLNYILLTIFTLGMGYTVSIYTAFSTSQNVIVALILTVVTVVGLTIYAWKTEKDFTIYGGVLFIALTLLVFSSFLMWIFPRVTIVEIILDIVGLLVFAIYLIYDTQLLMSNKRYHYESDDYILAAMNLYLDIINIFIELLSIMNNTN